MCRASRDQAAAAARAEREALEAQHAQRLAAVEGIAAREKADIIAGARSRQGVESARAEPIQLGHRAGQLAPSLLFPFGFWALGSPGARMHAHKKAHHLHEVFCVGGASSRGWAAELIYIFGCRL